MNKFLKIALTGCVIVMLYIANTILFESLFTLDMAYAKNIAWECFFSFFMTAVELALINVLVRIVERLHLKMTRGMWQVEPLKNLHEKNRQ